MRKNIPKIIKDAVKARQKNRCCACLDRGQHLHHILAFSMGGDGSYKNLILLCEHHHKLFHLGDPETYQTVYEYAWFVQFGKLPEDVDLTEISNKVVDALKLLQQPHLSGEDLSPQYSPQD